LTVRDRIEDAELLWKLGRRGGAFLSILVAIAAASAINYPKLRDRERFEKFVGDGSRVKISIEFRGQQVTVETLLYKFLRCELVHDGAIPCDIVIVEDQARHVTSVRAGGAPEYKLQIGTGWYFHLLALLQTQKET
jgi:hypothetical protein